MSRSNVVSLTPAQSIDVPTPDTAMLEATIRPAKALIAVLGLDGAPNVLSEGWRANLGQAWAPAMDPGLAAAVQRSMASAASQSCQVELQTTGDSRWFVFDISPWPSDGGPAQRLVASGRDITDVVQSAREAREAKALLAEQNRLFDAALSNIPPWPVHV